MSEIHPLSAQYTETSSPPSGQDLSKKEAEAEDNKDGKNN